MHLNGPSVVVHSLSALLVAAIALFVGCEANERAGPLTQPPTTPTGTPERAYLELLVSAKEIVAFDPLFVKVVAHNPAVPGAKEVQLAVDPSRLRFLVAGQGQETRKEVDTKRTWTRDASMHVKHVKVPVGESRVVGYDVLYQPREWQLTTPGQWSIQAAGGACAPSPPITITVTQREPAARNHINRYIKHCHAAIGVRETLRTSLDEPGRRIAHPTIEVNWRDVVSSLQLARAGVGHGRLRQTLDWTLAFARLNHKNTHKTRAAAIDELMEIRATCDQVTQEVIDATLIHYLHIRIPNSRLAQKHLDRISLQGWPWDYEREAIRRMIQQRPKARGAKPPPKQHEPVL
jgi:hypothetical protein